MLHLISAKLRSLSILTSHVFSWPQNGQSKLSASLGFAFLGGGLAALLRLPLRARASRGGRAGARVDSPQAATSRAANALARAYIDRAPKGEKVKNPFFARVPAHAERA